ncbi:MAG: sugar transferase [Eubacteriales bacterium]|nr:sugar transferase [Eubacteriales bacterium]
MSKREDYKRFIVFCLASLVILAQAAVFAYVWYDYYRELIFEPFWRKGNWVLIAIYALLDVMFSKLYGGLKVGYLKRIDVFYSLTLATICTNVVTYFQITLINRWFLPPWRIIEMTGIQIVIIIVWTIGSRYIYSRIYRARRLLVIYGERDPGDLIHKMDSRKDKYNITGKVHADAGEKEIHRMMKDYDGVIIWDLPSNIRNQYLKYCFAHSIRCYFSPKISDIIVTGSERIHLFDTPLLVSKNMGLSVEQRAAKRLLDIVVSGIGIVVASPLMLIIAVLVKAYDGGPVFYYQDRLTIKGTPFKICKFRSMCVDSEKNGARLASKHDSRITPVGRVLRNLHLDELPQLFNVFKGEMSLVGPRPERKSIMKEYQKELPEFYYRLKVKAGLTGYAQVYGKYNTTPYDKLKLDLYYIENYSFLLDIKLLFMTVKIFFQKEVSEGVEDTQVNALKDSSLSESAAKEEPSGDAASDKRIS